ncbi:MAG: hypothetical protein R3D98_17840 [Candidatus Krumholzibacteriia bacterium]
MNTLRSSLARLGLVSGCLLALGLSGAALAAPYDFDFRQGPDAMVIPTDDYRQFHSRIINTGDNAEAYNLTVELNGPANWTFSVCYDEVCYPPFQTEFRVPETGTLAPGESVDFDFDIFALFDSGVGEYTITFAAESDPSVTSTYMFTAQSPVAGQALLFSPGEGVLTATIDDYVQFHPVFYNAGTTEDSYTLSVERDVPGDWQAMFCVGGVCYPPFQESIELPVGGGTYPGGAVEPLDIDFATLFTGGLGRMTVTIRSNTDPSIFSSATFTVTTGSVVGVQDAPGAALVSGLSVSPNPFNPALRSASPSVARWPATRASTSSTRPDVGCARSPATS